MVFKHEREVCMTVLFTGTLKACQTECQERKMALCE